MSGWDAELAKYWRNYVPPCRPSQFDLGHLSNVLDRLRPDIRNRRPRVLILGSTTEYRDWAFEERVEALVVDSSPAFYTTVSAELTHHNPYESWLADDWRTMSLDQKYDLAVGDLVVGNVPFCDLPVLLDRVNRSLHSHGRFATKSFFARSDWRVTPIEQVFQEMADLDPYVDPFPMVAYELTLACVDSKTHILSFESMFKEVERSWKQGLVSDMHMDRFREFGWDTKMKFDFTVPTMLEWETAYTQTFDLDELARDEGSFLVDFPLFILKPLQECRITRRDTLHYG